jgi:hypothetical protein
MLPGPRCRHAPLRVRIPLRGRSTARVVQGTVQAIVQGRGQKPLEFRPFSSDVQAVQAFFKFRSKVEKNQQEEAVCSEWRKEVGNYLDCLDGVDGSGSGRESHGRHARPGTARAGIRPTPSVGCGLIESGGSAPDTQHRRESVASMSPLEWHGPQAEQEMAVGQVGQILSNPRIRRLEPANADASEAVWTRVPTAPVGHEALAGGVRAKRMGWSSAARLPTRRASGPASGPG